MDKFNFEQWLSKHTYWEDADTQLIFISSEDGGVLITDYDCRISGEGETLEKACINFEKNLEERHRKIWAGTGILE